VISIDTDVDYPGDIAKVQQDRRRLPRLDRRSFDVSARADEGSAHRSSASIVVRIFGPICRSCGLRLRVAAAIGKIDGLVNLKSRPQVLVAQVEVRCAAGSRWSNSD